MRGFVCGALLCGALLIGGAAQGQCLKVGYEDEVGHITEEIWVQDDRYFGCPNPILVLVQDGRVVAVMREEDMDDGEGGDESGW